MLMRQRGAVALVLGVIVFAPATARPDATVWSNGAGLGGATVHVIGSDGAPANQALKGTGTGEFEFVSAENANVTFGWGPDWRVHASGFATQPGASYGGVASIALLSGMDLFGNFEPPGPSGTSLRITGSGYAHSLDTSNEADIHYALLAVHPDVIPEGFQGTADDLIAQAIIMPNQVLARFSASYNTDESFDDLVLLGGTLDQDNVTLLAWVHGKCVSGCLVPTLSQWGVGVMTLLILTAGTILVLRRRAATA